VDAQWKTRKGEPENTVVTRSEIAKKDEEKQIKE
jgi:hypothetical protein